MTDSYSTIPPSEGNRFAGGMPPATQTESDTAGVAREQAGELKDSALDAGNQVVGTAKDQAAGVVDEARTQARGLLDQAQSELREQASAQQRRAASGLRGLSEQLGQMAGNADTSGVAVNLVQDASSRVGRAAAWLDGRDPGSLLDEVKRFARNRPGTFIAGAIVAGVVAGRLARSVTEVSRDQSADTASSPSSIQPTASSAGTTPLYESLAESHPEEPAPVSSETAPIIKGEGW